jgi:hypothetical protein
LIVSKTETLGRGAVGVLEDIMKALDRSSIWKRLQALPPEVDELKARIATLEEKLNGKWPGDVCRFCGARAARFTGGIGNIDRAGMLHEMYHCSECAKDDERWRKP